MPRWSAGLATVAMYLGKLDTCAEATATLEVVQGLASAPAPAVLAQMSVRLSCDSVTCDAATGRCAGWQTFDLPAVTGGQRLSLLLRDVPTDWWAGVSPPSPTGVHGGPSSLVVSPLFATKYAHYTFRTYMDAPAPTTGESVDSDAGSAGSGVAASVIVVSVLVALAVLLTLGFVYVRRSQRGSHTVDPVISSEAQAPFDSFEHRRPGGRKRPIQVRPVSLIHDDDVEFSAQWATRVGADPAPPSSGLRFDDESEVWSPRQAAPLADTESVVLPLDFVAAPADDDDMVLHVAKPVRRLPRLPRLSSIMPAPATLAERYADTASISSASSGASALRSPARRHAIQVRAAAASDTEEEEFDNAPGLWATRTRVPTPEADAPTAVGKKTKRLPRRPRLSTSSSAVTAVGALEADDSMELVHGPSRYSNSSRHSTSPTLPGANVATVLHETSC